MMKHMWRLMVFILVFNIGSISSFALETGSEATQKEQFKVVGYYSGELFNEPVEKVQTQKMTHVIYAFLIPKEDGNLVALEKPEQLKQLVAQAHRDGAKVFIALGGWSYKGNPLSPVFETVAASKEKRGLLIRNVSALVETYDLDGVELDWEHPNSTTVANYEKLVVELKGALDATDKELTAALSGAWSATAGPEVSKLFTDACLDNFDFINVMAYDLNEKEHSPLWFAETSIDYWLLRGVPAEKIVLGMPLYARPSWMQYRHLVAENPEYAFADYAATAPLASYYNGINTMREKTVIALKKAGGVMLFDVNEDTMDETSIVSMMDNLVQQTEGFSKQQMKRHISVILNNQELVFLEKEGLGVPFIDENNRTLIPLRKTLEAMGAEVGYDENNRMITARKGDTVVKITVGENVLFINGQSMGTDSKAAIIKDRAYIPLRAVFAAFGYDMDWHGSSQTIYIYNKEANKQNIDK